MKNSVQGSGSRVQAAGASCRRCHAPQHEEDLVLFWTHRICWDCNRELAGVLRDTVNMFIGIPSPSNADQMRLL